METPEKSEKWKHSRKVKNENTKKGEKWKTLQGSPGKKTGVFKP